MSIGKRFPDDNSRKYAGSRNLGAHVVKSYDIYADTLPAIPPGAKPVECISDELGEVDCQRFALKDPLIPW